MELAKDVYLSSLIVTDQPPILVDLTLWILFLWIISGFVSHRYKLVIENKLILALNA